MFNQFLENPLSMIVIATSFILIIAGMWVMLVKENRIRIILGFSLIDTGTHMLIVAIGYIRNRTAPIIDAAVDRSRAADLVVDPIPSALVLTAIVIGLGVTALMLTYAVNYYRQAENYTEAETESLRW
jgi:multisubunit Na+/H+ antiporter MnhC subunit